MAKKKVIQEEKKQDDLPAMGDDFIPDTQPVIAVEKEKFELSSNDHRQNIKKLVDDINQDLIHLGELLYQAQRLERWKTWGYQSFKDYVDRELAMKYGRARILSDLWADIGRKDPAMFKEIVDLGTDKAYELKRIINRENKDEWLEKGKNLNYDDLKKEVRREIQKLVPKDAEESIEKEKEARQSPVINENHTLNFSLTYEDFMAVQNAISLVKTSNPSVQSASKALGLICADYVGSAEPHKTGSDFAVQAVKRYEDIYGLEFVIVDKKKNKILMGDKLLQGLVAQALAQ